MKANMMMVEPTSKHSMMSTTMNSFHIKSQRQQQSQNEQTDQQEVDEMQVQFEQDLSKGTLAQINSIEEHQLADSQRIRIKLDFTLNSLYDLPQWCPSLTQLKISESLLVSLRDLGTRLPNL